LGRRQEKEEEKEEEEEREKQLRLPKGRLTLSVARKLD
jgi:hypothetical protein